MFNIKNVKTILVTGGAGFIGSNFLNKYVQLFPEINFVNLDAITYAADLKNILVSEKPNYKFIKGDIRDKVLLDDLFAKEKIDAVIHFAAESHVDFSITNPGIFVETNVLGTEYLAESAKKYKVQRFHHISTDEVYGELVDMKDFFRETTPLAPNSPYSASKASSDFVIRAYVETFGLDAVTTRCSNNYGPNQDTTKLIPKFISLLLQDKHVPLYAKGQNIRDWLYVEDHCDAIWKVFTKAEKGQIYNIGGNSEKTNIQITQTLLKALGKDESYIDYVADRAGHDFRYAIDAAKIKTELGWEPKYTFEEGIKKTIEFYKERLTK